MKTNTKLINYYEKKLDKIIKLYGDDWRKASYIEHVKIELEAVRNGRKW